MNENTRQQGAEHPVSSVMDNHRNLVERFEVGGGPDCLPEVRIRVTLAPGSPLTAEWVEAWYWAHVGEFAPEGARWEVDEAAQKTAGY